MKLQVLLKQHVGIHLVRFATLISPSKDNNIILVGTTQKQILVLDRRQSSPALVMDNDAMINSVYACKDGLHVISGDSSGNIKMWDLKRGSCRLSQPVDNDQKKPPISHLHISDGNQSEEGGQYLAVNCYDNGK